MLKDLSRLSKLVIRTHWASITGWCVLQIFVIGFYRKLTIVEAIQTLPVATPSNSVIFALASLVALSFMVLIIFLGHLFSSGQRGTWIRQLPIDSAALNLFPLFIVFSFGLVLLLLIPWGAFSSGVSVFCIGIPVAVFLNLKNSSQIVLGIFRSAALGVILIFFWLFGFYDWSRVHPKLLVEFAALVSFTLIWLLLDRNERRYVGVVSVAFAALICCEWVTTERHTPNTFSEAVINHDFSRSEKTWQDLRRIALDAKYWDNVEQFDLPSFVRYRSQEFVQKFTSEEKIAFIRNIEFNRLKWQDEKLPKNRPLRFASYLQPEFRISSYSKFPIGRDNIDEKTEEYLYANWVSSELYCDVLPQRPTNAYLEKAFLDVSCYPVLFNQAVWTTSLFEKSDYTDLLDKYLLNAFEHSPAKTRSMMLFYLGEMWGLSESRKKYEPERYVLFSQKDVTPEQLSVIKEDRFRSSLAYLKALADGREPFLRELDEANSGAPGPKLPISFICQYVLVDCHSFLDQRKLAKLTLPEAWLQRLHGTNLLDDTSLLMYWIAIELRKEQNWPRIEKLINYAKSRTDL